MQKIAVAVGGNQADSYISKKLSTAKYLFIVDLEEFAVLSIIEAEPIKRDIAFAKKIVEEDCEALICGLINKEAFNILYLAGISRYDGTGMDVTTALKKLGRYELEMIRDHVGGSGCAGDTSGEECHEH